MAADASRRASAEVSCPKRRGSNRLIARSMTLPHEGREGAGRNPKRLTARRESRKSSDSVIQSGGKLRYSVAVIVAVLGRHVRYWAQSAAPLCVLLACQCLAAGQSVVPAAPRLSARNAASVPAS